MLIMAGAMSIFAQQAGEVGCRDRYNLQGPRCANKHEAKGAGTALFVKSDPAQGSIEGLAVEIDGQPKAREHLRDLGSEVGIGDAESDSDSQRRHEPERNGFPMGEALEPPLGLERVTDGVAKVQVGSLASLTFVSPHDAGLYGDR